MSFCAASTRAPGDQIGPAAEAAPRGTLDGQRDDGERVRRQVARRRVRDPEPGRAARPTGCASTRSFPAAARSARVRRAAPTRPASAPIGSLIPARVAVCASTRRSVRVPRSVCCCVRRGLQVCALQLRIAPCAMDVDNARAAPHKHRRRPPSHFRAALCSAERFFPQKSSSQPSVACSWFCVGPGSRRKGGNEAVFGNRSRVTSRSAFTCGYSADFETSAARERLACARRRRLERRAAGQRFVHQPIELWSRPTSSTNRREATRAGDAVAPASDCVAASPIGVGDCRFSRQAARACAASARQSSERMIAPAIDRIGVDMSDLLRLVRVLTLAIISRGAPRAREPPWHAPARSRRRDQTPRTPYRYPFN